MDTRAYHLAELEIARSPGDSRRTMTPLPANLESILDVGCGAGQTLIACDLSSDVLACGLDIDSEALALGKTLSRQILATIQHDLKIDIR